MLLRDFGERTKEIRLLVTGDVQRREERLATVHLDTPKRKRWVTAY